jgi:hypothetical protein
MIIVGSRKMVVYDDVADDKIAIYDKGIDRKAILGQNMDFDNPQSRSIQLPQRRHLAAAGEICGASAGGSGTFPGLHPQLEDSDHRPQARPRRGLHSRAGDHNANRKN